MDVRPGLHSLGPCLRFQVERPSVCLSLIKALTLTSGPPGERTPRHTSEDPFPRAVAHTGSGDPLWAGVPGRLGRPPSVAS